MRILLAAAVLATIWSPATGALAQGDNEITVKQFLDRCGSDRPYCERLIGQEKVHSDKTPGTACVPASETIPSVTGAVVVQMKKEYLNLFGNSTALDYIDAALIDLWPCPSK